MRLVTPLCCAACLVVAAGIFIALSATNGPAFAQPAWATAAASTTCDLNATPDNLASIIAAAQPGQTVCLASGSYGTFTGAAKAGRVTIQPAPGASVGISVDFNGASNITVTGVTLNNATLEGATHDVTLSNSTVAASGQIVVLPDQMTASSNIVIDHNTLQNQSCGTGLQGRIDVQDAGANNSNPVGLTISNNYLSGGTADGVRLDAGSGIQVLGNTFTQLDDVDPCHTDAIQIYGSASHVIMKGNFFYSQQNAASCSLGMWDGGDHNVFENNVVAGTPNNGCYGAVALLDDDSSTVIHNVFAYGGCLPHGTSTPCGDVTLGGKTDQGAGTGTLIRDNIMTDIANGDGGLNATYSEDHNLCHPGSGCRTGNGDINGVPVFAGGSAPTTFSGFALCAGSPGVGRASDGTNMGLELPVPVSCGGGAGSGGTVPGSAVGGSAPGVGSSQKFGALMSVRVLGHTIRRGAPVTFMIRLSKRAKVTIKLLRFIVPSGKQRRGHYKRIATLVFKGKTGLNRMRISKVRRQKLHAGRYRAIVTAGGKPRQVGFTVKKASNAAGPRSGEWARSST